MAKGHGGTRGSSWRDKQSRKNSLDSLKQKFQVNFLEGATEDSFNKLAKDIDFNYLLSSVNEISNQYDIEFKKPIINIENDGSIVTLYFRGKDKNGEDFNLKRNFKIDKNGEIKVNHERFEIPSDLQAKGIAKKITADFYNEYKRIGVKEIDLMAWEGVGAYAWARYGFTASKQSALEAVKGNSKAESLINNWYNQKGRSNSDRFPMSLIAEQSYGKNTLMGSFWQGYLDLTDSGQRKRFESYLKKKR